MSLTPSRRSLIKAGAWTAPAIVLATAAPAFAVVSGANRLLTLHSGTTGIDYIGVSRLQFRSFTITPGDPIDAGGLTMTVTNPGHYLFATGTPSGWTMVSGPFDPLVYVRTAGAAAGETIVIPDGAYFDDDGFGGAFNLAFSAPTHDVAQVSFAAFRRRGSAVMSEQEEAQLRERQATS